jgi:CRP-like cAMP-binding protein
MGGALVGGLLFEGLNYLLNKKGGFVRKRSLLKKQVSGLKRKTAERLMKVLSRNRLLSALNQEEIVRLTPYIETLELEPGEILVHEGDEADAVFFIARGRFAVERSSSAQNPIAVLDVGDVVGEIAVVSDHSRMATVRAIEKSEALKLSKETFHEFLAGSKAMKDRVTDIAKERIDNLVEKNLVDPELARALEKGRITALRKISISATEEEIAEEAGKHGGKGGGAVAIWLGIALDGIPESLVIGMLVVAAAASGSALSLAFIAGVFLANLPEAMSSAVTMRSGGMSIRKIMLMWGSLCLLTAVGGFAGAAFFPAHPEGVLKYIVFGLEGLAAGAMLTMIAETMLPEAFEQGGGTIAGLSTLVGFLAALAIKLI